MSKFLRRYLRSIAQQIGPPDDLSGARKNRKHTKKGPGRMPFRRSARR